MGGVTVAAFAPRAIAHADPFMPEIGVCRGPGEAEIAHAANARYLEVNCRHFLAPDQPRSIFEERAAELAAARIPARAANGFLPGRLTCTGPRADHSAVVAWADVACERAAEVGIRTIVFGSGAARRIPDGYPKADAELQLTALLARLVAPAQRHGVTIALEPLQSRETNIVNRVDEAIRIVGAVGHERIGITADVYHMLCENEGPESIRAAGSLIKHAHIAEKAARTAPGVAGDDFTPYLAAFRDIAYPGPISLECRWRNFKDDVIVGVKTLRAQLRAMQ